MVTVVKLPALTVTVCSGAVIRPLSYDDGTSMYVPGASTALKLPDVSEVKLVTGAPAVVSTTTVAWYGSIADRHILGGVHPLVSEIRPLMPLFMAAVSDGVVLWVVVVVWLTLELDPFDETDVEVLVLLLLVPDEALVLLLVVLAAVVGKPLAALWPAYLTGAVDKVVTCAAVWAARSCLTRYPA